MLEKPLNAVEQGYESPLSLTLNNLALLELEKIKNKKQHDAPDFAPCPKEVK